MVAICSQRALPLLLVVDRFIRSKLLKPLAMIMALIREPVVSLVKDGKQLARMLQTHIKTEAADCTTVDENVVQYHDKFSALLNIIRQ